jgi:4-hydroxy-tetrahydrodipicolinate synthase
VELVQATKAIMTRRVQQISLVIGTGTNHTRTTVQRIELAGDIGADAVLVVTPYYSRPSQEGILEHYRRAAQVGVPVIAYEVPSRTGIRLCTNTIRKIMDLEGVIGLKDSSGGIGLITELSSLDTKPILCGEDIYFHDMLSLGAHGGMLASANVNTNAFIDVFLQASKGDLLKAKQTFDSLIPFIELIFQESNPSPLKWILAQQGIISTNILRLPMGSITKQLQLELERLL